MFYAVAYLVAAVLAAVGAVSGALWWEHPVVWLLVWFLIRFFHQRLDLVKKSAKLQLLHGEQ
jgi:hypothetical protein